MKKPTKDEQIKSLQKQVRDQEIVIAQLKQKIRQYKDSP